MMTEVSQVDQVGKNVGFEKYQHVERLFTAATEGIDRGEWHAFVKLDGTNGSIWMDPKGEVRCGSRNNVLGPGNGNRGFYEWVMANRDKLSLLLSTVFRDCTIYGEFLVPHTFRGYADHMWNNFYVFDVYANDVNRYLHHNFYSHHLALADIKCAPVLVSKAGKRLDEETIETLLAMEVNGIDSVHGVGEGIVVKRYDFVNKFGRIVWGKFVKPEFKQTMQQKEQRVPKTGDEAMDKLLTDIAEKYITQALVDKTVSKLTHDNGGDWGPRLIPMMLGTIYYDFINEELYNALKYFHSPTIDFKRMRSFVNVRIKQLRPDLF